MNLCDLRSFLPQPLSSSHPVSDFQFAAGRRVVEGYVVLCFGAATFKITRLLCIAMLSVHLFACLFYRVKKDSAESQDDLDFFYESRNVNSTVMMPASITMLFWEHNL